jgi:hypothetical protein
MKFDCWSLILHLSFILIVDGQLMKPYLNDLLTLECNQPLVTLYIFSSQTNPTWKINITQIVNIKKIANKMVKNFDNETMPMKSSTRIMGYQGFSISCSDKNEIFIHGNIPIENELLESGRTYLSSTIVDHVREYIGQTSEYIEQSMSIINDRNLVHINCNSVPIKGPDSVPVYNPQTDNGGCFITKQSTNNCYAYGN